MPLVYEMQLKKKIKFKIAPNKYEKNSKNNIKGKK